ncbi:protein EE5 [Proboscivirus elephantidbeta5]|uniref:Protein EE5 n=1 Tax=Elephant endotheliotropic herpesvirus 5 TaxID=768738 RepID=A0A075CZQ4_9BETA|nr:protein EE5 [Elephant endotheliotropic herpesvirus 5]AHC02764.1 protein EE5 [Elephant endotheliotropic herpesvirus 5]
MRWFILLILCVFITGLNLTISDSTTTTTTPTSSLSSPSTSPSNATTTTPSSNSTNSSDSTTNTTTTSTASTESETDTSTTLTTTKNSSDNHISTKSSTVTTAPSTSNTTSTTTTTTSITTTPTSGSDTTSSIKSTEESTTYSSTSLSTTHSSTSLSTTPLLSVTSSSPTSTSQSHNTEASTLLSTTHISITSLSRKPSNYPSSVFASQVTSIKKSSVTNNPSSKTNIYAASITSANVIQKQRNGYPTTSFLDGSLSTTLKPKVNNTAPLGRLYNSTANISSSTYGKILASLNISIENVTTCHNVTENITVVYPSTISPESASVPSNSTTSISPYYSSYPSIAPTQYCNVTRILKTNVTYLFKPIYQDELSFVKLEKNDPFITVLITLDTPEEHEDKRVNETHESFCMQFSDHLEHEQYFNFNSSSSFNHTKSVVSLDKCKQDTSVIVFSDHSTWYRYPQGVFLYALSKILQYYHFDEVLTKFISTIDDHKCMFEVRSKVQYSREGDKYTHYLKRHVTSWGVCNNFYQHVNITRPVSLPK